MKKIVLVGGNGFIGKHLNLALHNAGCEVVVVTRTAVSKEDEVSWAKYVVGDYGSPNLLASALEGADSVVHLAHDSLNINRLCDMTAEYERNIQPSINLMEACLSAGVRRLVFVSSGGTVYGNPAVAHPLKESEATNPISLYGTSKLTIEQVARLYFHQRGLPVIIVRPANAYGPGQIPFKGQGLVATAFASAINNQQLTIFGNGEAVRDYVHVDDIADAIMRLLQLGAVGEVYNIGTGIGTSILSLLEEHILPIVKSRGYGIDIKLEHNRTIDVAYNVLSVEKTDNAIGFNPRDLSVGLEDSWAWVFGKFGVGS